MAGLPQLKYLNNLSTAQKSPITADPDLSEPKHQFKPQKFCQDFPVPETTDPPSLCALFIEFLQIIQTSVEEVEAQR